MSNHSKTKIIAGLFYVFVAFLLFAQEPKKPVLKLISHETIEKRKWNPVKEIYSENGKFKGVVIYGLHAEFMPVKKFTLMDSIGNIIWEKSKWGSMGILIANDGTVIGVEIYGVGGPHAVAFYDPKGNLIRRTHKFKHAGYSFSPDGNYFLINSRKDGLLAYDLKGKLVQNYGSCFYYAASQRLKTIVINYQDELRFFRNGKLEGVKNIEGRGYIDMRYSRIIAISPDGQYIAIVTSKKLYFFEINKVRKLWEVESEPNSKFLSVDLYPGAEKVVAAAYFLNDAERRKMVYGYIYIYDQKGVKLTEHRIDYPEDPKILSVMSNIDISEDGEFITVNTGFDKFKFELE